MSSKRQIKPNDGQSQRLNPLRVYTACISGLGSALLLWSLSNITPLPRGFLLFLGLIIIAELTSLEVFAPQVLLSVSSAVAFASLLLYGPLAAGLVAMAGGLAITLVGERRRAKGRRAPLIQRALFNAAAYGLATALAGGVYLLTGGKIGEVTLISNLMPLVLAAIIAEFVNSGSVVTAVALQTGQSPWHVWRQNVSWAIPMTVLSIALGGGGLAFAYQTAGVLGLAIFFLPIALTTYAYRLYVQQTQAHLARLDDIVAERVDALKGANQQVETA